MKRWGHHHSIGAGALLGLTLASYRIWLLLAFAFLLGSIVTLAIVNGRKLALWVGRSVSPLSMRRWKSLRRRVNDLRPDDLIPY